MSMRVTGTAARHAAAALTLVLGITAAACTADPTDPREGSAGMLLQSQQVLSITGAWSGYQAPARLVIADEQAWAAAWATIHYGNSEQPPLPAIDFAASVLVLAAMGERPSTGYAVTIREVRASNGTLNVTVLERSPGSSCYTGAAITSPVHVVEVPRQGTTGNFTVNTETYRC
jgi:hypothetical protein